MKNIIKFSTQGGYYPNCKQYSRGFDDWAPVKICENCGHKE